MPALGRPTSVVLTACMLFAASCGSADREADLIEVSDGFHAALERRDGAGACSRVSADTVATLEQHEKRPCSEAILELDLPAGARASGAGVYVTSGYADLPGSRVAFLDQGPEGWHVSAAGCVPSAPGHPFDCELGG